MWIPRIAFAILIAALCAQATVAADRPPIAVPVDSIAGDPGQSMEVSTNSPDPVAVEIRKSHRPNDTYCHETEGEARATIAPAGMQRLLFAFARQRSPGVALYEWHVCFVIDGTTYRAWHGFDPGPGAALNAHCFIDTAQIAAKDLTKNICPTADVTANPANYREFSINTPAEWTPEPCNDATRVDGRVRGEECFRYHGAFDGSGPLSPAELRNRDPRAPHLNIRTNSSEPVVVYYRLSRTPDDYDCKLAQGTHWTISNEFTVAAGMDRRVNIGTVTGFNQQFTPATAVYEWHICFAIGTTMYRAWRGYDPGPRGALTVDCFLDSAVLAKRDTTHYVCSTSEAALNPANYNEFGIYCEAGNPNACRRFGTKDEYDSWRALPNPLSAEEQDQIAEAVLKYAYTHSTYVSANLNFPRYLSIRGRDPSADFLQRVSAVAGVAFMPGSQMPMQRVGTVIQTGGNMLVSVGTFTVTEPNLARGGVSGFCGVLCAGGSAVTVQKRNGVWEVQSFTLTSIQ